MTIAYIDNINPIISQLIYTRDDVVDQIVRQAILEMASATDEMVDEFKQSHYDKKSIEGAFGNLREQAKDLLADVMDDLKKACLIVWKKSRTKRLSAKSNLMRLVI
jgi:nucleoid-associated protein YejK